MKNFSTMLQNGNLTPKERYLLLVQSDATKQNTGKEPLTEADKKALLNWQAKTTGEATEWNKYNEAYILYGKAGLEAELIYWEIKAEHYRKFFLNMQLMFYPFSQNIRNFLNRLQKIKVVDIKEATEIVNKQREQKIKDGLDFDYAVYELAFESLSEEDKKSFNKLYGDVEIDHQYLDQEEIIANLFNGKDELTTTETKKVKEKLAELVAGRCYNEFAKEYQLFHYFACIPLAEVARYFLIDKEIKIKGKMLAKNQEADDEDSKTHDEIQKAVENYAKENKITVEAILKEACLKWLDEDLLDQYTPLVFSNSLELFNRWLKTKAEARVTLQKLIDKGELKIRERTADETKQDKLYSKNLYDIEEENAKKSLEIMNALKTKTERDEKKSFEIFNKKVITGESLYSFKGEYEFIKDFKKRADEYDANLGIVYEDNDPEQKGEHLDQELLVTTKNNKEKNELSMFSFFGLTIKMLETNFEMTQFIEETEKDGEVILDFNSETAKTAFRETREGLINDYSKLLSFKEIFKKLSKIYEANLSYIIDSHLKNIDEFIDQNNNALNKAMGYKLDDNDKLWVPKYKKISKMKDDLFIDKEKILPDENTLEIWSKKFEDILGDEF